MSDSRSLYAVTGANGYVGGVIASHLRSQGAEVVELNRRMVAGVEGDRVIPFRLGDDIAPQSFEGVQALVHCAYDFGVRSWKDIVRVNVEGSRRLFAAAHAAGVPRVVFISTLSAFEGCRSRYGQAKLETEKLGGEIGALSVRPGLIFDDSAPKGMVGALSAVVAKSPVVPLVGTGKPVLFPCHADDLVRLVEYLCTTQVAVASPITAASPHGLQFRQILSLLARKKGRRVVFVPVPYPVTLLGLRSLEALGLKTRLRSDSLISLINQPKHVDFSSLMQTGVHFRDFGFR